MSESLNLKCYLKAFDSLNHYFLLGYGNDFIKWVEMLLECQESCIINGGSATKYFKLQKGAQQGDSISADLFFYVLKLYSF